ncbi:hypothetical protein L6164_006732 [Bauhinia variegata]|uniref:Uncharacterized protein n=1 Tax=Bauhinia variegata TaxID=167791 RepID=A0ACB9PUT7_BAUVA|nr:hypothetical protein L6164_006732 [Bauhinia variegata]
MTIPHFLVIPYPIQGMVNPFMQFSLVLAKHGCKITFVNTEFNHNRAQKTTSSDQDKFIGSQIKMVTLPDGLSPQDGRTDQIKVLLSVKSSMPSQLHKLIQHVNAVDLDNKINCIVVSINMGWALEVGCKLGIKGAVLFASSATSMALCDSIQRLIDEGIIESQNGKKYL